MKYLGNISDGKDLVNKEYVDDLIAPAYDSSSTYEVGKIVIYDNKLYKCNTAITVAETWTPAHWTEVKVSDGMADTALSVAGAAADARVTGNILRGAAKQYAYTLAFQNGGLRSSDGSITNTQASTRLRSPDYISITTGWPLQLAMPQGLEATVYIYSSNNTESYEGRYGETGWNFTEGNSGYLEGLKGKYIKLLVRRVSNADITSEDAADVALVTWVSTDTELSTPGVAADAKVTGDMFNQALIYRRTLATDDDLDSISGSGTYSCVNTAIPINWPISSAGGTLIHAENVAGIRIAQVVISYTGAIYSRYKHGGSWSSWRAQVPGDTNVMIFRQELTSADDLDAVVQMGVYRITSSSIPDHAPSQIGGALIVFVAASPIDSQTPYKTQIYSASNRLYVRYQTASGWEGWRTIADASIGAYMGTYENDITAQLAFQQGAINSKTGENITQNYETRIRSRIKYPVPVGGLRVYTPTEGYKLYVMQYDSDGVFVRSTGWLSAGASVELEYEEQIRLVVAYEDNAVITAENVPTIILASGEQENVDRLPELKLTGDTADMSKDTAVDLAYSLYGTTGSCTVKWQGSSSLRYAKKNYTIKLDTDTDALGGWIAHQNAWRKKNGNISRVPTATWGQHKKYVLKANYIDASQSRNIVSARLWGQVVASRSSSTIKSRLAEAPNWGAIDGVPIMLSINGNPQGLHTLNMPKDPYIFGMGDGAAEYIVSGESNSRASSQWKALATFGGTDVDYEIEYAPEETADQVVVDSLNAAIGAAISADEDWETALAPYVDIESVTDYFIFMCCISGIDNLARNILYGTYDGTKWFMSAYDMDSTYGSDPYGTGWNPVKTARTQFAEAAEMHRLCHLLYRYSPERLISRYRELRAGPLSDANVWHEFSAFAAFIPEKAYLIDRDIWPETPGTTTANVENFLRYYQMHTALLDAEIAAMEANL